MKVVPLRMEETAVEALDEAWGRHGYRIRVPFIRTALARLLREHGEEEAAAKVQ
jgi:metal-responsive CopG/Arc/MetJ family transcriptional regulator